jgi:hypothetical protein
MENIVSRNLSVHQEHEVLLKLEKAGLTSELAQIVIESKENAIANGMVSYIRDEISREEEFQREIKRYEFTRKEREKKDSPTLEYNTDPFVPTGWKVESHAKNEEACGKVVNLYLSPNQKREPLRGGHLLKHLQSLTDKILLNANTLDFFLRPENQKNIPGCWINNFVCFWGTIYIDDRGRRCLYFDSNYRDWNWKSIEIGYYDDNFSYRIPAAVVSK